MRARETPDILNALAATVADAVAAAAALLAAAWLRYDSGWLDGTFLGSLTFESDNHWTDPEVLWASGIAVVLNYFVMRRLHLYRRPQTGRFGDKIPRLLHATAIDAAIGLVIFSLARNRVAEDFSTGVILLFVPIAALFFFIERCILFHYEVRAARRHAADKRMVVVGTDAIAARLVAVFRDEPRLRVQIAGLFSLPGRPVDPALAGIPVLGPESSAEESLLKDRGITQLVVADSANLPRERLIDLVRFCDQNLIRFLLVPDLFRLLSSRITVESIDDVPLLGLDRWPLENGWNRAAKRVVDIFGALVGLVFLTPVIFLFGFLHRRESPGPLFYAQTRCGYFGRPFKIYKLRTMRPDAEAASGPVFATPEDPRRTRLGSWMREHNIDELPQFWNVLKGDMSLVGPRPERPVFVEQFSHEINHYMWRHNCRPGITGWAQVNGYRGDTSIRGRLECDLFYLQNWSLALDLKILFRTVFSKQQNAY